MNDQPTVSPAGQAMLNELPKYKHKDGLDPLRSIIKVIDNKTKVFTMNDPINLDLTPPVETVTKEIYMKTVHAYGSALLKLGSLTSAIETLSRGIINHPKFKGKARLVYAQELSDLIAKANDVNAWLDSLTKDKEVLDETKQAVEYAKPHNKGG